MALHTFADIVQGTPEWDDIRRGMVTASVVGQLITAKTMKPAENITTRSLVAALVAERITGHTDETYVSDDMWNGHMVEPFAVEKYSEHHAPVTATGFLVCDDWGYEIGYSPDGLVGDDGLVEVKSRRQKKHLQTILADRVPTENVAQIQCGLLVSGRDWCDYISYCGGMPLYVKRVYPDDAWHEAIVTAVAAFETSVVEMVANYRTRVINLPTTERIDHNELGLVF